MQKCSIRFDTGHSSNYCPTTKVFFLSSRPQSKVSHLKKGVRLENYRFFSLSRNLDNPKPPWNLLNFELSLLSQPRFSLTLSLVSFIKISVNKVYLWMKIWMKSLWFLFCFVVLIAQSAKKMIRSDIFSVFKLIIFPTANIVSCFKVWIWNNRLLGTNWF